MKAHELMIGDWVRLGCTKGQIHELGTMFCDCIVHDNSNVLTKTDCIRPIPLTKEILEVNGWVDADPNLFNGLKYVFIYGENGTLTLNHWSDSKTGETYYTIALGGGDRIIKYVHELQRVLRCCGLWDMAEKFKVI